GELAGVRVSNTGSTGFTAGAKFDLMFPNAIWHPYLPEDGQHYGVSALSGCFSAWCDKWLDSGALDVRRLLIHNDAVGSGSLYYSDGVTPVATEGDEAVQAPNENIARQTLQQRKAGAVTTLPSTYDEKGNRMWE